MKIQFINRIRRKVPIGLIRDDIKKALSIVPSRKSETNKILSLAIIFISDAESWRLNRKFLKKNRPASVLSFDYGSEAELILAPDFIRKKAVACGRSYVNELRRMIAHGLIHLSGLHHEKSLKSCQKFEKLERELEALY